MGLAGGLCIGAASLIASGATGRIPGISGVCARLLAPRRGDTAWRALFLAGLIAGAGLGFVTLHPSYEPDRPLAVFAIAGLLVGFGTRLGGGCTSGHGICGIGLGARDSVVATIVFMAAGMVTVYVTTHLIGGTFR